MILTITKVSQEFAKNGAEYRKVTGTTEDGRETTKSVFDKLKFLWPLLDDENVIGSQLEFKLMQSGQFWNVINIKKAGDPWPEETSAVKPEEVAKKPQEGTKPPTPQVRDSGKNKAFAVSYAKDLAVATVIPPEKILIYAEVFNRYMNGDITLKDPKAFDTMIAKYFIDEAH